ncbi:hypothetical protein ISN45_Aa03g038210 [Arabidopsis thaliana x Arabidopsis arenosa]|uniref:Uncharacterized protein n=1 Tax=Arabidopsis thaliana x Arabidopsis arenosa TaxID=1240361 RepID=A0A8T2B245_9BRAS|nr:hypothetical protein ISN45_Aa03g038210 [Arabidopsis thaliana x Arabidopsis arenosa]
MVWSSSDGSEASLSGRADPYSDAESSSEQRGSLNQFAAREDTIADVVRDEDLPDDPEAVLNRRTRPPASDEAGVSRWQDVPELPVLPEVKGEMVTYDPEEGARLLQLAIQGAKALRKKTRAKKVKKPDPPGSTLSTSDSLRELKARFNFSEGVTLRLPTPNERADDPPEGFFTLYEGFFYFCFLWFPIPRPIIEYMWSYKLALAQITTRGLRHLVGILVRGIETYNNVGLDHLRNLLEIRRVPSCQMERYYISPRSKRRVIGGFPSKDEKPRPELLGSYSRGPFQCARRTGCSEVSLDQAFHSRKGREGIKDSSRCVLFYFLLFFRPEAQFFDGDARGENVTEAAEKKAREEQRSIEAAFGPLTLSEATGVNEVTIDPEVVVDPAGSGADLAVTVANPEVPEGIPIEDVAGRAPEIESKLVVGLRAGGQTKSQGKRPRKEHSEDARKRSKKTHSSSRPIYKDKVASANLIASCAWPLLPAPEGLVEAERYGDTAANFLKAFSSMNTMVHSYDSAARAYEAAKEQAELSRVAAEAKVAEAALAIQSAEALVVAEQDARRKMAEEHLRAQREAEAAIESLNRLLTEEKSLREAEVTRATKAAKRELTEEFVEKVKATEAKLGLFDKVSERYIYFSQAKANSELIETLESGGKIEEEKEEVLKWKEEYGDAEAEYARLGAELLGDLKVAPVSPDSVQNVLGDGPVEVVETEVVDPIGPSLTSEAAQIPEKED